MDQTSRSNNTPHAKTTERSDRPAPESTGYLSSPNSGLSFRAQALQTAALVSVGPCLLLFGYAIWQRWQSWPHPLLPALAILLCILLVTPMLRSLPLAVRAWALIAGLFLGGLSALALDRGSSFPILCMLAGALIGHTLIGPRAGWTLVAFGTLGQAIHSPLLQPNPGSPPSPFERATGQLSTNTDAHWGLNALAFLAASMITMLTVQFLVQRLKRSLAASSALVSDLQSQVRARDAAEQARDRAEQQLRQSQRMEAIGRLAGAIAHDINNTLTVVMSGVEHVQMISKNEQVDEVCNDIQLASENASQLTRQLLAFGQRSVLAPTRIAGKQLVHDSQRLIKGVFPDTIEVDLQTGDQLPTVQLDPNQVKQALLNIAMNAREAMNDGGRFSMRTSREHFPDGPPGSRLHGGEYLVFECQDTGTGMNESTKSRAFEPFFTTKDKTDSSGLGLSTALGIIQQSSGHMDLESNPGQGCKVLIYLPASKLELEHPTPTPAPENLELLAATVLVSEDDSNVRKTIQRSLQNAGCEVLVASDGEEAYELARMHQSIDLLCTDALMPGLDGMQLASAFRALHPHAAILICSGQVDTDNLRGNLDGRLLECLPKPFTERQIASAVRQLLARRPAPTTPRR